MKDKSAGSIGRVADVERGRSRRSGGETDADIPFLPDELWVAILLWCADFATLDALSQVSRRLWSISRDDRVWRQMCVFRKNDRERLNTLYHEYAFAYGASGRTAFICCRLANVPLPRLPPQPRCSVGATYSPLEGVVRSGEFDAEGRLHGYGALAVCKSVHDPFQNDPSAYDIVAFYEGRFEHGLRHGCGRWRRQAGFCRATKLCRSEATIHCLCPKCALSAVLRGVGDIARRGATARSDPWLLTEYNGSWHSDRIQGTGKATYVGPLGALRCLTYEGEWLDGMWHGQGHAATTDGHTCTGAFKRGRPCGQVHLVKATWTFDGRMERGVRLEGIVRYTNTAARVHKCIKRGDDDDDQRAYGYMRTVAGDIVCGAWNAMGTGGGYLLFPHEIAALPDDTRALLRIAHADRGDSMALDDEGGLSSADTSGDEMRRYAVFHGGDRDGEVCAASLVDSHGRYWSGCAAYERDRCHCIVWRSPDICAEDALYMQEITFNNGDLLQCRWRLSLLGIVCFRISATCPDARFAGHTFAGCTWQFASVVPINHRRPNAAALQADGMTLSDSTCAVVASRAISPEWIFWPSDPHSDHYRLFCAYVQTSYGPWTLPALDLLRQRLAVAKSVLSPP